MKTLFDSVGIKLTLKRNVHKFQASDFAVVSVDLNASFTFGILESRNATSASGTSCGRQIR